MDCLDKMVSIVDNGKIYKWTPSLSDLDASITRRKDRAGNFSNNRMVKSVESFVEEITPKYLKSKCSSFQQFCILFRRMSKQIYRNKVMISVNNFEYRPTHNFFFSFRVIYL